MCSQVPSLLGPAGVPVADSRPNVWASWAVGAPDTEPGDSLIASESFSRAWGAQGVRRSRSHGWMMAKSPGAGHKPQLVLIAQLVLTPPSSNLMTEPTTRSDSAHDQHVVKTRE
jgi:hypothetical protein